MKIKNYAKDLIIFMMLFLTSGFWVYYDAISSRATIGLWVLVLMVLLYNLNPIKFENLTIFAVLIGLYVLSGYVNGENVMVMVKVFFSLVCGYLCTQVMGFKEFTDRFTKVMKFLCISSLICMLLYTVIPQLSNLFIMTSGTGGQFSSLVLFNYLGNERNYGIFWEPGAYQSFLLLAILFEYLEDRLSVTNFILYVVTLITTFSTTGYIGLALVIFTMLFHKNKSFGKIKSLLVIGVIGAIGIVIVKFDYFFVGAYSVFGKILYFFENNEFNSIGSNFTTTIRYYAIIKPIEAFLKSPLLGMGASGLAQYTYDYTLGMNTCTFINYFASFGIVYGILAMRGYWKLTKIYTDKNSFAFLLMINIFVITISENYVNNAMFFMLILYGFYDGYRKERATRFKISFA